MNSEIFDKVTSNEWMHLAKEIFGKESSHKETNILLHDMQYNSKQCSNKKDVCQWRNNRTDDSIR